MRGYFIVASRSDELLRLACLPFLRPKLARLRCELVPHEVEFMRHSRIKALPRELVTPVALAVLADRFLMDSPKEHRGIYGGEPATLDVPVQGVCGCWRTHIVRAELLGGASSSRSSAARQRRGRSRHARSRSSWIRRIISRLSSSVSRPASKRTKPSTTCSGMGV